MATAVSLQSLTAVSNFSGLDAVKCRSSMPATGCQYSDALCCKAVLLERERFGTLPGLGKAASGDVLMLSNRKGPTHHHNNKHLKQPLCVMEPPSKEMRPPSISIGDQFALDIGSNGIMKGEGWRVLPDIWKTATERHGDSIALSDPHRVPGKEVTFRELEQAILDFGEGLRVFGVNQGQCVSLFSDNSYRWIIADQGIMSIGASDAVRGAKAPSTELLNIANHSESSALILESEDLLVKLGPKLRESSEVCSRVKFAILLWSGKSKGENNQSKTLDLPFPVHTYEEVMAAGRTSRQALAAADGRGHLNANIRPDDIATIVYTSGTSGNPKGVMLTHANLMHQIRHFETILKPSVGDTVLSLLPPWHMYERSGEYFVLSRGCKQIYSSVKTFKEDLSKFPPDYFLAVPLVFDILYNGVQKKLAEGSAIKVKVATGLVKASENYAKAMRVVQGLDLASAQNNSGNGQAVVQWVLAAVTAALLLPLHLLAVRLVYSKIRAALGIRKAAISGGGSLPPHVDKFFGAIGIMLLNGYGLTETSPVLAVRKPTCNVLGTVGTPLPETEIRVVDPDTGKVLPMGSKGLVKARGPQVMKGYYKNPAATSAAIDDEGFFSTGDLGWLVPEKLVGAACNCGGQLVLEGRVKDTIVLANGENVEPAGIEETILQSKFVQQVMLVGQDKRKLGALIVPNQDELNVAVEALKSSRGGAWQPSEDDLQQLVRTDVTKRLTEAGCIHDHERIGTFRLLKEQFTVDNGLLTPTMKMKREVISEQFKSEIDSMYRI